MSLHKKKNVLTYPSDRKKKNVTGYYKQAYACNLKFWKKTHVDEK